MARMYSRKKGKSGSLKPIVKGAPKWTPIKPGEVESMIEKMSKKGMTSSQIGIRLRDQHGVPSVKALTGKRVLKIKREKGVATELPEDMLDLIKKMVNERKHLEKNKRDLSANYGLQITESKIRRLTKYYKRTKAIPPDWKFDYKKARLLVE